MVDSKKLTDADYARAASDLGVPVAAIRAVTEVESRGSGFLPDGRPVILYERHIMRRRLQKAGLPTQALEAQHPELVNARPGGYQSSLKEWDRLAEAIKINRASALESCSWGLFQIMGYHWELLGYASVQDFVNAMYRSEGSQLEAFVRFIKANPHIHKALKALDWRAVADGYNGPGYAVNKYDVKLAAAFARHSTG